jgi:hypothetical protein
MKNEKILAQFSFKKKAIDRIVQAVGGVGD